MKLVVSQKNLKKGLSIVEKIVSKNASLPILNNVLLKTENGRLKLSATNLEVGATYSIGAKIDEPGEIAVPVRIFSDFISNINEDKVSLVAKNNTLHISYEKYKTQILAFDSKDFPIIPKVKTQPFAVIPAKILKNALLSVLDSVAVSETRPELAGVYMNFNANQSYFAATDSFRLAERTLDIKTKDSLTMILPRNTVTELIRISGDIDGDLQFKFGDNQLSVSNDDMEIISRVIDGSYPDYRKVIPEKWISKVLVSREELDKKTRLAGLFSSHISDIKMTCDEKSLSINAKNSDKGEIHVAVDSVLKNEPFEISLNYHYLLDGLKVIPTEHAIIEYTGLGSPLILRPEGEIKNLTYIIMPLRS